MKKIAIVTDSNSGITQKMAKKLGVTVIPMPFYIDEQEYFEDVNLSNEEFFTMLTDNKSIKTSQPSIAVILDTWNSLLESYDEIIHMPMSSELSASYQTAYGLASDFDGKVFVVNNQRISVTLYRSILDAKELIEKDYSASEICEHLEAVKFDSSIYIMVNDLKYLKNGGRITPAAATIGTVLNLKPVLELQGGKLDAYAKCRGVKLAKAKMIDAMKNDLETRFKEAYDSKKICLYVAHTNSESEAKEFKKELKKALGISDIEIHNLSLSVSCHIGPGALAVACSCKL